GPGHGAFYWPVWSFAVGFVLLSTRCHGSCSEKELEKREEEANIVLTGTVEEILNMDPVHNTYSCKVRVWRYLKGKIMVNGEVLLDGGNKVMIGGFGDPHICDNRVATGDTRIFFVNLSPHFMWPSHKNELMLNSSLMRITLRNLEEVEHCVEGKKHFSDSPPFILIRGKLCGFGAVCERDTTDPSKGECVCKKIVCTSVVAPVCGSDSSTYSNECELEKAQCNTQRRIKVMRRGPCGKSTLKDPCSEVSCSFGSTCIQSSDGLSSKCMCPLSCENVPKHVVCGSDGLDYQSECELNMKACATQKNIRVHHQGRCGESVEPLNTTRSVSGGSFSPGRLLAFFTLLTHVYVCLRSPGGCPNGCKFNAMCLLENGAFRCSCNPIQCDGTYKPLCGKDGKTYPNDCERKLEECRTETGIPVKQQGPCDLNLESPCLKKTCEFGAVCVVKNSEPVCECSDACPQDQDPVCGSDGHAYSSSCQMKAMGCALQKQIQMQHKGPCANESCTNCSFGAICDAQTGRCVCPKGCLETRQPVCGSDGMTYENECKLNVEACTKQLDLRVVAHGECKTCGSTVCSWGARCLQNQCECQQCTGQPVKPVCGSDGTTYDNDCELWLASCKKQRKIEVTKPGVCDEDCGSGGSGSGSETCEQDRCQRYGGSWDDDTEDDRCVCDFNCQTVPRSLVCGSDGTTYTSECELKKARCEKQMDLLLQSQGPCPAIISAPPELIASQHCSETVYGCCQDNKTAALGVGLAGCPSVCQCNHYGSYRGTCDPSTGQCSCKPGVGGLKCDRCEPGFWNFRGIVTENMSGCTPCNCDGVGSVRDDCEQMSGLCSCKPGVKGMKCNVCPDGSKMGANGCDKGPEAPKSCDELVCHFGASCVEVNGQAHCECPSPDCDEKNKPKVCGSDGVTYADRCQLRTIACRQDKEITVDHLGQCKESIELMAKPTPFPTTHRTPPPTAHVKITKQRHGHTTTTTTSSIPEELDSFLVEALPPPKVIEAGKYSSSFTTHRPTTLNKPPRTSSPPLDSSPDFDESGSGEPSGDEEMVSGMEESGEEPLVATTTLPTAEERSSCDNTPFGCCPDGKTAAISSEGTNCPSTMRFSGLLHLDKVEGQEVFYTPEMEDPKSELFGETARSIESALNELFHKSDVQKDFQSIRVKNLAPSNSILAFIEAHFDPDTRFSVEDIEGALLKQLKASKDTGIVVKKPEEDNIPVPFFTTTTTTVASVTTPTTTMLSPTSAFTTLHPTTTRRPFTSRKTTTASPATTTPSQTPTTTVSLKNRLMVHANSLCDSQPCRHGGTCEEEDNDFTCICPAGRGGAVCEKVIKYFIPSFGGKSYLAFRTMRAYHTVRIAMEFRASEMTGILLYNGQKGKKDFLSLALVEGHVELRFNTGSGTASVISKVLVRPGRWHQLVVVRNRRNAMLSVDNEPSVEGQSPPGTDGLNLDTDLFIGGVLEDMIPDLKERTSVSTGLVGCIRMLDVNNFVYNLQENGDSILYGSGVGECGNNPCLPNPCKNGASCQVKEAEMFHCKCVNGPTCADAHNPCDPNKCHPSSRCQVLPEGGYKCECPMGREGKHCEKGTVLHHSAFIPYFTGDSFLELKGLHLYGQDLSMTVVLLANDSKGMIFYNGQKTDGKGDFISLSLNDGILEFRYDLGKGPAVIRSKEKIKLNEWNTVNLERASRKGEISINGKDPVRGEAPKSRKNQHTDLNLKESLFVGGAPDFRKVARAAAIKDGFKGAIQKITLMGIPILKADNALHSSDVSMHPYHPCYKDVCENGGRCNPLLDSYECVCLHGFAGQHCQDAIFEKSAGDTEAIAFDGHTFIEYHNGVTKSHPAEKALLVNKFELSIRTESTHGLILWNGKGVERSDYIALAIVDGRVQMTYDLGSKPVVLRSSVRVNTNRWIRIKASRALRDGSLQVGNEAAVTGSSPLAATQLDTDGALWLGGLEELSVARRLPKAYSTGFVGCVKDMIVDGVQLHLVEDALNSPKILHCSAK
uniref:Agrin n=1 Tax=Sinocyclocheilus grahami TaxID=75366 RepID=A0A672LRZ6_SINGR